MNSDTATVLKCGWGLFFLVAGIVSLVLDLAVPGVRLSSGNNFPIVQGGSFTMGWLFMVGLLIVPAACARQFGATPINGALSAIWCTLGFLAWVVVHSITSEIDASRPVRPNLALVGGLILCWRLLVRPTLAPNQTQSEEPHVHEGTSYETPLNNIQATEDSSEKKYIPERKASAVSLPVRSGIANMLDNMCELKKRILVGGIFLICAAFGIYAIYEDVSPSLSWAALLSGMWCTGIWLLPDRFFTLENCINWRKVRLWTKQITVLCAVLAGGAALLDYFNKRRISGAEVLPRDNWEIVKIGSRDYVAAENIRNFYDPLYAFNTFHFEEGRLWLGSPKLVLKAEVGSQEILINNIKIIMSDPVLSDNGRAFFSRGDLREFIDPVLCPSHIRNTGDFDTVVIDASHGGEDAGALGMNGNEKDLALKMAFALRDALHERGFKVVMTRTTDIFVTEDGRVNVANATPKSIFISLHYNSGDREMSGIETIALPSIGCSNGSLPDTQNIALATAVHANVISRFKFGDLGIKREDSTMFVHCQRPGIIFKGGFVSNSKEGLLLASDTYRKEVSNAIGDAVVNYRKALKTIDLPR